MPNQKKLAKMREANYRIVDSCETYVYRVGTLSWGYCARATYDHEKHGERPMPSHRAFICDEHVRDENADQVLGVYADEKLWKAGDKA